MILQYGDELEADFFKFYHLDIALFTWTEGYSCDRAINLMKNLPIDSAFIQAINNLDNSGWSVTDHLLATVLDLQMLQIWQFSAANSKKKPPKPKPFTRPGKKKVTVPTLDVTKLVTLKDRTGG